MNRSGKKTAEGGRYVAARGIHYSPGGDAGDTVEIRIEPGEPLPADFPAEAIDWLRECGAIERPAPPEETK